MKRLFTIFLICCLISSCFSVFRVDGALDAIKTKDEGLDVSLIQKKDINPGKVLVVVDEEVFRAEVNSQELLEKSQTKSEALEVLLDEEKEYSWITGKLSVSEIKCISKPFVNLDSKDALDQTQNRPNRLVFSIELLNNSFETTVQALTELQKNAKIYAVQPNYYHYPCEVPNDAFYLNQVGFSEVFSEQAWDVQHDAIIGEEKIDVAIIDSGIAPHPDLVDNLGEGYDFVNENNITTDDEAGHGTVVAGVLGSVGNNGIGTAGVCWSVNLIPLQTTREVERDGEILYLSDSLTDARAVEFATNENIPIINYSRGGGSYEPALEEIIYNYPGLFVCAAGNGRLDLDVNTFYPVSYNLPNMISVAAIDTTTSPIDLWDNWDTTQRASNFGDSKVHIAAPGVNLFTAGSNGGYVLATGTSYASPMVAGAAALLKSVYPSMTAGQIKARLLSTATYSAALDGEAACGGYLNIGRALSLADPAYETKFSRGYSDTFGTMSLWENKAGIYNSSDADISVGGGTVVFENNSVFHFPQTTPHEYHYRRLSSQWVTEDRLGTEGVAGVTIDLKLKLDMIPIHENVTAQTAKYGQTGFIINTHMDSSNQEFYLCIAQKQTADGVRVVVTSFSGNRHQIDSIAPQEIILNIPDIDDEFQRFTFSFDASSRKINVYYNGEPVGQFNKPMKRISPSISQDFVCFSLVNRMELNGSIGEDVGYSYSRAELDYLRIYNQTVYPEDIWLMTTT